MLSPEERRAAQLAAQRIFAARHPDLGVFECTAGTLVALPSLTLQLDELRKVTGIQHYEERLLFLLLALRHPELRVVYLTSTPLDKAIVRYHLDFLPDPTAARERLDLVSLDDPSPLPLTRKVAARPDVIDRLRAQVREAGDAWLLPFNVTPLEQRVAELAGLAIYGPRPELATLGSKSGSRRVAREAGVPVVAGLEDLYSVDEIEVAATRLLHGRPERTGALMLKLNDGYSGLGNAIIENLARPITSATTRFSAPGETWASFGAKVAERGAVVEALLRPTRMTLPSVLVRITPGGGIAVVATHEQVVGGPNDDIYLGCRFPAEDRYRAVLRDHGERVGKVLASRGVIGMFGIDFMVAREPGGDEVYLGEINLRLGGTTHPFGMALLATGASYEHSTGHLVVGGHPLSYVATDNLESARLIGSAPAQAVERIRRRGLALEPGTARGATLHMLGAVSRYGKIGFTCIGTSEEEAKDVYNETLCVLTE
jgi:hypothetical protein